VCAVIVALFNLGQAVLFENVSLCKIKLVRTFSISPAEFTLVAFEFLAKVKSPAPLSGIWEYNLAAL
jgi:hypothetical protein